jgi:hypothetical protein|tara:strand:+ start:807 stop:1016 length:210 start_codon:yes stop_codon:yes gene_type:complete
MAKTKKTPFELHGIDYFVEDLTEEQMVLFQHIGDLERKTKQLMFNLDQLNTGKEAYLIKLQIALTDKEK